MSLCTAWSYVTRHPQAQMSHPICHPTQRQNAPCQQIPLKLSHGFNTCGTCRGTFKTGWILCSTCREISCFLVEGGLLSSFLASGDVQLLFHHLLLFKPVPLMCGGRTEEPQRWLLQVLLLTVLRRTTGHRRAVFRTVADSDNSTDIVSKCQTRPSSDLSHRHKCI